MQNHPKEWKFLLQSFIRRFLLKYSVLGGQVFKTYASIYYFHFLAQPAFRF
jgi:hypothetical protein